MHCAIFETKFLLQGVIVAGYGSGHIRMFNNGNGNIMCEISAHNGWLTGGPTIKLMIAGIKEVH